MKRQSKRTTQTIVAAISLLVVVIAGIAGVDEYRELCRAAEEAEQLRADWDARQVETRKLEEIQGRIANELRDLQTRATGPDQIEAARDRLIDIVRLSGSRLRQLEVSNQSQRAWASEGDHPAQANFDNRLEPSRYRLHSQTLELRAEGNYEAVRKLMDLIAAQNWLMTTNRFTLEPASSDRLSIAIELTITLYGLSERAADSQELAAL